MTNKEKYYDELINYALVGVDIAIGKNTNKIMPCKMSKCSLCKCGQYRDLTCGEYKLKWLNEEYIEPAPETDWSKVEVDTPILVKNIESQAWIVKYFAKNEDGKVWCWSDGRTSYTTKSVCDWEFAKIPTPEELEQYRKKV